MGHLTCLPPLLDEGRKPPERAGDTSTRPAEPMLPKPTAGTAAGTLPAPHKRCRGLIPPPHGRVQQGDNLCGGLGLLAFQGPPLEDPLDRLGHVQP